MTIYLAGPMEDTTLTEMKDWRERVKTRTEFSGIKILDPTRRVGYHDALEFDSLQFGSIALENPRDMFQSSLNISRRIFKQDMQDIANSKVILANVKRNAGKGIGTNMELMFAHTKNKIIILWAGSDDTTHPFYESIYTEKHYSLENSVDAALEYL